MPLISMDFFSECMQRNVEFKVILPNQDGHETNEGMKTLVLLHGYCGCSTDWIVNSKIVELASKYRMCVISPSGENSFYLDGEATGRKYATYVGKEIPDYVARTFNIPVKREDTFISGYSMGGFGAVHVGLKFPERFGGILGLSSALLQYELPKMNTAGNGVANRAYYEMCFGDLPSVAHNENNPDIQLHNIVTAGRPVPNVYLACGTEDRLNVTNRKFAETMENEKITYVYKEDEGIHDFVFWNKHLEPGIKWLIEKSQNK